MVFGSLGRAFRGIGGAVKTGAKRFQAAGGLEKAADILERGGKRQEETSKANVDTAAKATEKEAAAKRKARKSESRKAAGRMTGTARAGASRNGARGNGRYA